MSIPWGLIRGVRLYQQSLIWDRCRCTVQTATVWVRYGTAEGDAQPHLDVLRCDLRAAGKPVNYASSTGQFGVPKQAQSVLMGTDDVQDERQIPSASGVDVPLEGPSLGLLNEGICRTTEIEPSFSNCVDV